MNDTLIIRVLQVGMTQNIGGVESYLMQQFRHLDKKKIIYDFVNVKDESKIAFEDDIQAAGGHVFEIKSRRSNPIRHYWQWYRLMIRIAKDYHAIVINSNDLFYVFPLLIAKLFGIPQRIMHSHTSGSEKEMGYLRSALIFVNKFILRYCATQYFACSRSAGVWMFGENTPVTIIHNAIETDRFIFDLNKREKLRKKLKVENVFVIGHVARFSYAKNHMFLIEIFKIFHDRHPNSILWLIGGAVDDGSLFRRAKKKVHEFHLEDAVRFMGMRKDVADLYQAMDCFVLPSRFEGLPIVGIEAQASGLPCIMSKNITEEVKITDLMEFASLARPEEWVEKLERTMETQRGNTGQEIIDAGYDIDHEIRKVEALYLGK